MDPMKSSEKPRTPLKSKNSATNTEPARCGFCGSGIYIPTFTKTNSLRAFCPGSPTCKQRSDICSDNFSIHQPLFSSPPLLQPLFSNILVPPNFNTNHPPSPPSQLLEEHGKSLKRENSTMNFMFYQNNNSLHNKFNEDICLKRMENVKESHPGIFPLPSLCECTGAVPWSCSPYVMPLFSYYVFWNSQFSNNKNFPTNSFLQCDFDKCKDNCYSIHQNIHRNGSKKREEGNGEFWSKNEKIEKNEWKTNHDITGSSTSFVSVISLDYNEEIFLNSKNKKDAKNSMKNKIDNLVLDKSNIGKISSEKKHQKQKTEKIGDSKQSSVNQSGDTLSKENCDDKLYMRSCMSVSSSDEQENYKLHDYRAADSKVYNKQGQNEKIEPSALDIPIDPANTLSDDKHTGVQKLQGKKQDSKPKLREKNAKKCIKNFTMANEALYQFPKGGGGKNATLAAGGDSGGENCGDYKVDFISTIRKNSQEKIDVLDELEKTKDRDNLISEQCIEGKVEKGKVTSTKEQEIKKLSRSNTRCWPNGKSRIAKLTPNFKNKELTPPTTTTTTNRKKENEVITKRKHNCLAIESSTTENENNSKIQKIKNFGTVQDQNKEGSKKIIRSKMKDKIHKKEKISKHEKQAQNCLDEDDSLQSSKI